MRSIEWALLEMMVPVSVWLHLELPSLPQLILPMILVAAIAVLLLAIATAARRTTRIGAFVFALALKRARPASQSRPVSTERARPTGGPGPRAPALRYIAV